MHEFKINIKNPKRIVIVGAGLAGLTAAYYLLKNSKKKLDVTVIESSDRVGGRVKTMDFKGVRIDTGGFMIFKWYKHFFKLIKELGLSDHIVPFNVTEFYAFDEKVIANDKLPGCYTDKCKLVLKTLPYLLLGKFNVYNPDLQILKNKKVSDFVAEKSFLHKMLATLVNGYTYPKLDDWPTPLFLSMAWKMRLNGMFKHVSQFQGGTEILIRDLQQEIINYGGKIEVNQKALSYNKKKIMTQNKEFESDVTVFASTLNDKLFEHVFEEKIDFFYTKNVMLLVEYEDKIKIDKKCDWTIIYLEKKEKNHRIASIVNITQMTNDLDSSFVVMYMGVENCPDSCSNSHLLELINKQTEPLFHGNRAIKIHYKENWDKTMPDVSAESLHSIKIRNGKNGCYFIGDYTSWSSMEVAVHSGKAAASDIIKKFEKN